jgi:DNA-binding transcriptional MocR family regulator
MIDLRHNYPVLDAQTEVLRGLMKRQVDRLDISSFQLPPWAGPGEVCEIMARWLGTSATQQQVVLCSGGNHALTVSALALQLGGKTVVTDEFTYGAFVSIAGLAGIHLLPCQGDLQGMLPEKLDALCRSTQVTAVLLQPTIHNPTCVTMPADRRHEITRMVDRHGLMVIEDDAYRFLHGAPPPAFARLIPHRTVSICSFSKTFSPLLKLGCLTVPEHLKPAFETVVRLTSSGVSRLFADMAAMLVEDGTLDALVREKRSEGAARQTLAHEALKGVAWESHPTAFHGWVSLPEGHSADKVQASLKARGVDVSSGTDFAAPGVGGDDRLRFSLGGERDPMRMKTGLQLLRNAIVDIDGMVAQGHR